MTALMKLALGIGLAFACAATVRAAEVRGTGDLGIVVARASGAVCVVDTTARSNLGCVSGLGDLSHASAVFSPDQRYAYVFGRDGALTKVDILKRRIVKRIVQAGNAIGGAISDDGTLIAVSNYEPGGVRIFDAETLAPVADIPAVYGDSKARSKTVGLVDAPGRRFLFCLYDAGEIWMVDLDDPAAPAIRKLGSAGKQPYDALITPDGRHYIAGLFGEDGLAHVDLWRDPLGIDRFLDHYGRGEEALPVYKMPHLEGWAQAGDRFFLPAVGHHELLVVDAATFEEIGRVPVHGQPVFAVARPGGRHIWVNFAYPDNDTVQVVDTQSLAVIEELKPGPAVLHMEFTPRGDEVWVSVRDADRVKIYDTDSFALLGEIAIDKPSGIFFTARANRIGL